MAHTLIARIEQHKAPPPNFPAPSWLRWIFVYRKHLLLLFLVALTFFLHAYRLNITPDVHTDEYNYYRAAYYLLRYGSNVWPESGPIVVHPPLFYVCESIVLWLAGKTEHDMYGGVYTARLVNDTWAALTALMLFLLSRKLSSSRMGFLAILIFTLDPFVLRTNRRAMLETMTELLFLAGFYLYYVYHEDFTIKRRVAVGIAWGLALLTKELAIVSMVVVLPYIFFAPHRSPEFRGQVRGKMNWLQNYWYDIRTAFKEKRVLLRATAEIYAFSLLLWTAFPVWAASVGQVQRFWETKVSLYYRWVGQIQTTGWNRPGVSFLDPLLNNLRQYATSYILLVIGGFISLYLIFAKRDKATRYILAWSLSLYVIFAFVIIQGQNNDQYFYLLVVATVVTVAYALDQFIEWQKTAQGTWAMVARFLVFGLFLSMMLYNTFDWYHQYGIGVDNARWQLTQWVINNIPPGEEIGVSVRVTAYVQAMFPQNPVVAVYNEQQARERGLRYVVTSSKWLAYRFGDFEPEFYEWIETYGTLLYSVWSPTPWRLSVYRLES